MLEIVVSVLCMVVLIPAVALGARRILEVRRMAAIIGAVIGVVPIMSVALWLGDRQLPYSKLVGPALALVSFVITIVVAKGTNALIERRRG